MFLLSKKELQKELSKLNFYKGPIDGDFGVNSRNSVSEFTRFYIKESESWGEERKLIAVQQYILGKVYGFPVGTIDGFAGPDTRYALEIYQNHLRDLVVEKTTPPTARSLVWPRQKDVPKFFGEMGENLVKLKLPYPMFLSWDRDTVVEEITLHEKVASSAKTAFTEIKKHYGPNNIKKYGFNSFGGSFNIRRMRGGTSYSMHSWGIAIDFDPVRNGFRMTSDEAFLAKKECVAFWEIWEAQGWTSLGRERNYDWMHVQAARL